MKKENFYPSSSLIYGALYSNPRRINRKYIIEKSKERGIYLSCNEEREELIDYYSKLIHGYKDFSKMLDDVATKPRGEKTTSVNIELPSVQENIAGKEISLKDVKDLFISSNENNEVNYSAHKNKNEEAYTIDIEYVDIDYSKTRMIQKKQREAKIELIKEDNIVKIRYTANSFTEQRVNELTQIIQKKSDSKIEQEKIDFSKINNKNILTEFLTKLYDNINILTPVTVVSIKLIKPKLQIQEIDEATSEENETEKEVEEGIDINNAIFNGSNILLTEVYQDLIIKNYYVASIKWESLINVEKTNGKLELIAQFKNHDDGSDFVYRLNGIHNYNTKTRTHTKSLVQLNNDKITSMVMNEIEKTATKIYNELLLKYEGDNDG